MKIDVSTISGYADMTAEEKLAALESYEIAEPDYSGYVRKDLYDKAASEVADWKKKHHALLSEEEKTRPEREEELNTLREAVAAMKKEKDIAALKADYLAIGYPDDLADASAKASVSGDIRQVLENQKTFLESYEKTLRAKLIDSTPKPPAGVGTPKPLTAKDIMQIKDTAERQRLIAENKELFK